MNPMYPLAAAELPTAEHVWWGITVVDDPQGFKMVRVAYEMKPHQ